MNATTGLIVFLAAIIITIIIGNKTKCNIGVVGICFAFIIGTIFMGKSVAQVINYFPTSLMFMMMIVCFFYAYPASNGTITGVADRLVYACRNHQWAVPLILYVACFVVATLGAGAGAGGAIMSPIAFALCASCGFSPILAFLAVCLGALAGGIQAWTSTGLMFGEIAAKTLGEGATNTVAWAYGLTLIIVPTVFYVICYFVLKGYKVEKNIEIKKPQPFTKEQKITLGLVLAVMALVIIPVFFNMFIPNPATKWFASKFDIKVLCAIGIVICCALKLGNSNDVIKNRIPWGTIIMVCGMGMLISLAVETGLADLLGSWLGTSIPSWLIIPMVCLLAGLLSFVTTGPAVIFPLFVPMFPALAAATGLSPVALTVALYAGTGATGMSPFSQGGAMAVSGCADDAVRESLWKKQLVLAGIFLLFYIVLGVLGVFNGMAALMGA